MSRRFQGHPWPHARPRTVPIACLALAAALLVACAGPALPRVLAVGPGRALTAPSQAAARARDGDRIVIDPGTYRDCAVWRANRLTIEAAGPGVVITGPVCQGKALFVTDGAGITIVGLSFEHARDADRNGAGIRVEGPDLTVRDSAFIDNEDGILTAASPHSTLSIIASRFIDNGVCAPACAHGIYAGQLALLRVERSVFRHQHVGHHIKSRAARTEIVDTTIEDGVDGNSSYLIDVPNGGDVLIERNRLQKGPRSDNPQTAIALGAEGTRHPTRQILVRDNQFRSDLPNRTVFVRNQTPTPAELVGNRLTGEVEALVGPGSVR